MTKRTAIVEGKYGLEIREALFSECGQYRYTLSIVWDAHRPKLQVIGLNPSTATEKEDDATIRRCKAFAVREGMGGLVMTNIFAFRSMDPKVMRAHPAPIGENGKTWKIHNLTLDQTNDFCIVATAINCAMTVAAWGTHGSHMKRGTAVKSLWATAKLAGVNRTLLCFGQTSNGYPKHPLYLSAKTKLVPYE